MSMPDTRVSERRLGRTSPATDEAGPPLDAVHVLGGSEPVREARAFVRRTLRLLPVGVVDDATLIVSELVTNAVLHADGPSDVLTAVRLVGSGVRLRIEVHDAVPSAPVLRVVDADAEHGRGLVVVEALSECWGTEATPDGKCVWCELAI